MEGGDLRAALAGPQAEYLKWYEHGQVLARDIVSGLFFLHCPLPGGLLYAIRTVNHRTALCDAPFSDKATFGNVLLSKYGETPVRQIYPTMCFHPYCTIREGAAHCIYEYCRPKSKA